MASLCRSGEELGITVQAVWAMLIAAMVQQHIVLEAHKILAELDDAVLKLLTATERTSEGRSGYSGQDFERN